MAFRQRNRLPKYDYGQSGYYFVTVCTSNKQEFFGCVKNSSMVLNTAGQIAQEVWSRASEVYQTVNLDEFIIMPNHMHGIVIINPSTQAEGLHYSLPKIVGSYKNVVSKTIRGIQKDFAWQPSFYDHVIRKDESLEKIREYIRNNPAKWELDRNNAANLWM